MYVRTSNIKNVNKSIEIEQCTDVNMTNMNNGLFTKIIIELKNKYITKNGLNLKRKKKGKKYIGYICNT